MPSNNYASTRSITSVRSGTYDEVSSDVHNNTESPKRPPSAFSKGLTGRPPILDSGHSDDSDLPRLSPIRTSSGTALNTWERKQKQLTVTKDGRCQMSQSCFYDGTKGLLFTGQDSSDLSHLGSREESMTATSGICSALSEDVWQSSPPSDQPTKINDLEEQIVQDIVEVGHERSKSNLSAFFDNLTSTFNWGLQHLAIKVERATSSGRELSGMRSATETKPDAAFFEIYESQCYTDRRGKTIEEQISMPFAEERRSIVPNVSYDTSFNLCGGQELYEELEMLCNEYAKKLNKFRTTLSDDDKRRLDSFLTHLYPIFDVVGSPSESEDEGTERTVDDRLKFLYTTIDLFVGESLFSAAQKERSSVLEIANLVANPVNVLGSTSQIPLTPQTSRCAELYVELESAVAHGRHGVELIHEEAIQRIAQLSSRCVDCLLEIANELIQSPDSPKKVKWPSEGGDIGQLLRSFVIRLVHNMESVTGSFVGALLGLGSAYDENLQDSSVGQKAQGLACDLELDSGTAVMKVQESLRNLMYVVVYVTFDF